MHMVEWLGQELVNFQIVQINWKGTVLTARLRTDKKCFEYMMGDHNDPIATIFKKAPLDECVILAVEEKAKDIPTKEEYFRKEFMRLVAELKETIFELEDVWREAKQ